MWINPTLIIIDVQKAIDSAYHAVEGPRNNPQAEQQIAVLLEIWRGKGLPRIHIRHDSTFAQSDYRPGQPGNEFKSVVAPQSGETIIAKKTNSAFIGTRLAEHLASSNSRTLIICGVATQNSVEATVRMAGNLGYDTYLISDACFTFAKRDFSGRLRSADEVHDMSLANLHGEYCTVLESKEVIIRVSETVSEKTK